MKRSVTAILAATVTALTMAPTSADAAAARQRCNDISGSPLCIVVGGVNQTTFIRTYYHKRSGPKRYVGLYVALCDTAGRRVFNGYVSAGQVVTGGVRRWVSSGGCYIGFMRIGNAQYTTGRLIAR
ncbi:hypothetical protein E1292_33815 [Nonomuraea deserti]|uniref:Secreted protein n=1 Tax=Nonomuraea deserti TaxID=1848322 RepID=A0A4R4V1I1_9ACTN|nr:hypothetical protein [Nonomuraea deserti]TDC98877.1 hypothetical protein E1292_33815 [Nonomuraea deserti]